MAWRQEGKGKRPAWGVGRRRISSPGLAEREGSRRILAAAAAAEEAAGAAEEGNRHRLFRASWSACCDRAR